MPTIRRRPQGQPEEYSGSGAHVTREHAAKTKKRNSTKVYTQGFRQQLASASNVTVPININAAGKELLGISVIPSSGNNADITDVQLSLSVNNNNVLLNANAANANPNYVAGGMIYFPIHQPLSGNDTITLNVMNNPATTPTIIVNVYYIPQPMM